MLLDSLVAASVSTDIGNEWQFGVGRNKGLDEVTQRSADIVCVDRNHIVWRITCHILNEDSLDSASSSAVTIEDGTRAKEAAFFSRVPVEFNGVLRSKLSVGEHTECL